MNYKEAKPLNIDSHNETDSPHKSTLHSFREKYNRIRENITVEPIIACFILSSVFSSLAVQNLNLEKACLVNLKFGEEACNALKIRQVENYTMEEQAVQKLTASIQIWKNLVQTTITGIIVMFVGAWSDKSGRRKAFILTPIVGEIVNTTALILFTYFFYELPVEVSIAFDFLTAITGGWATMSIGVFSYIGDITSEESRTFRVGLANLCMSLGIPLGMACSGIMLQLTGYYGVFSISGGLLVFVIVYGYIYLEDPEITKEKRKVKIQGVRHFLSSFFDLSHVKETMTVAFKQGPRNRKIRVILLLVVVCVVCGPLNGEMNVIYLFTRYRFNWDEVQFSIFSTYGIVTNLAGTLFSISVFSNVMKLDDAIVGIISSTSKILSSFIYAFARNTLEIYTAPLIEIFNGTSFIAMRAMASKLVSSDELGKVNSLFGLAESMIPFVYGPMYAKIYMATLNTLPGAVFLVGGAMTVPAVAIFGWMYFEHKKDFKEKIRVESETFT